MIMLSSIINNQRHLLFLGFFHITFFFLVPMDLDVKMKAVIFGATMLLVSAILVKRKVNCEFLD